MFQGSEYSNKWALVMTNMPKDRTILKLIHDMYYEDFLNSGLVGEQHQSEIYVAIDCIEIARRLQIGHKIIFCRLYYHLDSKYKYAHTNGSMVHLFSSQDGREKHTVNFTLLSALVAEQEAYLSTFQLPTLDLAWMKSNALRIISIAALSIALFRIVRHRTRGRSRAADKTGDLAFWLSASHCMIYLSSSLPWGLQNA